MLSPFGFKYSRCGMSDADVLDSVEELFYAFL